MKKLVMFLCAMVFVTQAHAVLKDEILKIENDSNQKIYVQARFVEKNNPLSEVQFPPQGNIITIDSQMTKTFKLSELGSDWGGKEVNITDITIALDPFSSQEIMSKEFPKNHTIRITDHYIKNVLGNERKWTSLR